MKNGIDLGQNVKHIKEGYADPRIQGDLTSDSLLIMAMNITAKNIKLNNRVLTESEIDDIVSTFENHLKNENMVNVDWNQTS
jgi:hypothetical protein